MRFPPQWIEPPFPTHQAILGEPPIFVAEAECAAEAQVPVDAVAPHDGRMEERRAGYTATLSLLVNLTSARVPSSGETVRHMRTVR